MDIGIAFTYMFQDRDWLKKILIGGVISLIPIVNFAALGYMIQVVRNVRDGQDLPLPEWDQFGAYFVSGLYLFLVYLVYALPILLLACLQVAAGMMLGVTGNGRSAEDLAGAYAVASICLSCGIGVWALFLAVISPGLTVRFAETGSFGATLGFNGWLGVMRANLGAYLIVLILSWLVLSFLAPLGLIACLVGIIFTQFWAYLVTGHWFGQLAAAATGTYQPAETYA
ncbi:MAG: DUF4013 domain-containing protein [Anaerolineae bacterium]|nr:DUF4013 domain-containing protein [Anaerolineae bacterium]MDW8070787.1 DUF4013 domain-containing protein [Anaerolineae bacterium]